jgi:CTP synthase
VEVGGTVGDYENGFYIEALRELAFEEGEGSVCFVALTYIIEPQALGEQKSKAAQQGLKKLLEAGVQPHIVACRARNPVGQGVMQKIAMFSNVPTRRIFSMHDRASIYTIPDAMREAGLDSQILTLLDLHDRVHPAHEDAAREQWQVFVRKLTGPRRFKVRIGITGKYAALRDAYASIDKALEHAAAHLAVELEPTWVDTTAMQPADAAAAIAELDAVIVPGGFGQRGTEGKIACIRHLRLHGIPFLGICFGFQMAVIEFARHVCNLAGASSTEFDPATPHPVIDILPEQKKIEGLGGNMRLGGKEVAVKPGSLAALLFDNRALVRQRFRHRYEVDPRYIEQLEGRGMIFSGRHPQQPIMQILELPLKTHPYFVAAQFHPELVSRPLHPHPMFMGLLAAAIRHANPTLPADQISGRWLPRPADPTPAVGTGV